MFRRFWRGEECRLAVFRGNRLWRHRLPSLLVLEHVLIKNQAKMQEWKKEGHTGEFAKAVELGHTRMIKHRHIRVTSQHMLLAVYTVSCLVNHRWSSGSQQLLLINKKLLLRQGSSKGRMPRHSSLLPENLTMFLAQFRCSSL